MLVLERILLVIFLLTEFGMLVFFTKISGGTFVFQFSLLKHLIFLSLKENRSWINQIQAISLMCSNVIGIFTNTVNLQ